MLETKLACPSLAPQACCTCQRLLPSPSSTTVWGETSEKPQIIHDRTLSCCGRIICAQCIADNERFSTYCPFCQVSSQPSALPSEGLREPPGYSERDKDAAAQGGRRADVKAISGAEPPSYADVEAEKTNQAKTEDVVHHLHHPRDTIQSLSLSYNIPPQVLRQYNNLSSDNLILARHIILIPASHYSGPSLSTEPQIDGEEDERRKKIRRLMVSCKISEYDVAVLYLQQAEWDIGKAMDSWIDDERWEREHPMKLDEKARAKGKGTTRDLWKRRFTDGRAEKQ